MIRPGVWALNLGTSFLARPAPPSLSELRPDTSGIRQSPLAQSWYSYDAMERLVECVMNVSEGRDKNRIQALTDALNSRGDAHLLDCSSDADHHPWQTRTQLVQPTPDYLVRAST